MKNTKHSIGFIILLSLALWSCKNDKDDTVATPQPNSVSFNLTYAVDSKALYFDSLMYVNDAGNQYSVSRLWYYLSKISLIKADSSLLALKDYQFVDAFTASTNKFTVTSVPEGSYIGLCFNIGLDSIHNITNALPAISQNQNMEVPPPMGGGYHFMKFEGYYMDTVLAGFTMHLLENSNLITTRLYAPVSVGSGSNTITMKMNLNEWFRGPDVYDFRVDGNYTMGDMMAMAKLMNNGKDVFTLQ